MIHSMTGFGRGEASSDGVSVTAELKSVNSRYLNIYFHIPNEIQENELRLKEQIKEKISRGNLDVEIQIDEAAVGQPEVDINPELAKGYKDLLDELRHTAQVNEPISLQDLLQFDEIFTERGQDEEMLATIEELSEQALEKAIEKLLEMRGQEGRQLEDDLGMRLQQIESERKKIKKLAEGRAAKARDKLTERIRQLVDKETLDEERLEMEVAILADKMDITEEIVRLQAHIKFFREALENDEPVGRRLKFLALEMNRELDTIGSKANNAEMSNHVVGAKESLEQIREQVANVE